MAVITRKTVRSIALPAEHGGWSFWLEPVLLGMLVASSGTGIALVILSLASFLMRQPLKIALIDLRKKKIYQRTRVAIGFVGIYSIVALLAVLASLAGGGIDVLLPLVPAYGIAILQVWFFDIRGNSRHWLPEVIGAIVMSIFAISIALAGGWTWIASIALASIIVARAIPTIFYVRARLRQIKSGITDLRTPFLFHLFTTIIIIALAVVGLIPKLTIAAILILLGRSTFFLKQGKIVPAKIVGIQEIVFGLILVFATAFGYVYTI